MSSASPSWVVGALSFGAGVLAHFLLQRYEHDLGSSGAGAHVPGAPSSARAVELPLPLRDTRNNPKLETEMLNRKQNLEHVDFAGKRVLMRVDYNVKIVRNSDTTARHSQSDREHLRTAFSLCWLLFSLALLLVVLVQKNGKVGDATRITSTIPTLKAILNPKDGRDPCKCIVLITHLGRPAGNFNVKEWSVEPIVAVLKENLPGVEVRFLKDCVGEEVEAATKNCAPNTVFLCENLRFHPVRKRDTHAYKS